MDKELLIANYLNNGNGIKNMKLRALESGLLSFVKENEPSGLHNNSDW